MQIASPNVTEIANDKVYETRLRMSSKMDLRVQMDAKSGQLKNESKTKIFLSLVMHNRVQTEQR